MAVLIKWLLAMCDGTQSLTLAQDYFPSLSMVQGKSKGWTFMVQTMQFIQTHTIKYTQSLKTGCTTQRLQLLEFCGNINFKILS